MKFPRTGRFLPAILLCLFVLQLPTNVQAEGKVITILGDGKAGYTGDNGPADEAQCEQPFGLVIGPDGALYVCETANHVIRRIDLETNNVTTVAGTGEKGYSGDGGSALEAKLDEPYEIRFDKQGNMFFVEMLNNIVRRVDAKTGVISTVAGTGEKGFSGDGKAATEATFNRPHSICFDSAGHLYICDIGNHRVRVVKAETGIVDTYLGTGKQARLPDGARVGRTPVSGPRALDFDGENMWLALREGNAVYRIDVERGLLHHVAGLGGKNAYEGDGRPARLARLAGPKGISVDKQGNIFLADTESHTIRRIDGQTGIITTLVGNGKKGDGPDGNPLECKLNRPHGVFVAADGKVYIGDSSNHRVRCWIPEE